MDDITNLLYVLVFVVWFLYKTFSKGGKKAAKPMPPFNPDSPTPQPRDKGPSESTPPPVTFEDILRELTGAPTASPKAPEVIPPSTDPYPYEDIPVDEEETSFEVLEPVKEPPAITEAPYSGKFKEFELKKIRKSKAAIEAFNMMRSPQGAKKAFILKEIFERPYR